MRHYEREWSIETARYSISPLARPTTQPPRIPLGPRDNFTLAWRAPSWWS